MKIYHSLSKFIALTAAVVLTAASSCLGAVLNVPQCYQEKDQWCWDASSLMILQYAGITSYSQTDIANWAVGGQNIPNYLFNSPDASMKGCDEVLAHFGNITSSGSAAALSLSALDTEMASGHPVMIGVSWDNGGGHAIILRGTDGNSVYVNDPWPDNGQSIQSYDGVCRYLGNGTWSQSLKVGGGSSPDDTYYQYYQYYYNLALQYYNNASSYLDYAYAYYYYAYAMYYGYMYYGDSASANYYYNYYMDYANYYYDLYNSTNSTYYQYYEYYYNLAYQYYYYATSYLDYAYCYYYYAYAVWYYYMYAGYSSYADYYYDYYMYYAYYYYDLYTQGYIKR